MASVKPVQTAQVEEWLRSDVTRSVVANLKERAEWLELQRRGLYFPGEPYRTQEAIVGIDGHQAELDALIRLFDDFETLEKALNERFPESQRRVASGLPRAGSA